MGRNGAGTNRTNARTDAPDAAIEEAAKQFKIDVKRLMAVRRG
jgi:hypothetical protein